MMVPAKPDLEATLAHYGVTVTGLHGNRQVLCPAHDENVPSCSVNLDKQLIQCFSCGFAGDSISLIMLKEGLEYAASLTWAQAHLGYAGRPAAQPGRVRLSGESRPARGGYRPTAVRKRARLTGSSS